MATVIINADDFGLTQSCTDAIIECFEKNYITDTTIVANGLAFDEAVRLCREKGLEDCIGIHFNVTEGKPLTEGVLQFSELVTDGVFHGKINRHKRLSKELQQAIYDEFDAQVKRVEGVGINISHADSHHHIHTARYFAPIFKRVCLEHGIDKARLHRNVGKISVVKRIFKWWYNRWLKKSFTTSDYFTGYREAHGIVFKNVTELMAHPDYDKYGNVIDRVKKERGVPIGEKMYDLTEVKDVKLLRYRSL